MFNLFVEKPCQEVDLLSCCVGAGVCDGVAGHLRTALFYVCVDTGGNSGLFSFWLFLLLLSA